MTEWRPIPGYEINYKVSDDGQVWSRPRRGTLGGVLAERFDRKGYPTAHLCQNNVRNNRKIHQLVAEAFLGPCPEGMEVRHLDGVKTNSNVDNLTYGTHSENTLDKVRHGTHHEANKTHCPQGHPYNKGNTLFDKLGKRRCRECNRQKCQERYARRRAR